MSKEQNSNNADNQQLNIVGVRRSCYNCKNRMSMEVDVVCHMWCDVGERDFTFGDESCDACDEWVQD